MVRIVEAVARMAAPRWRACDGMHEGAAVRAIAAPQCAPPRHRDIVCTGAHRRHTRNRGAAIEFRVMPSWRAYAPRCALYPRREGVNRSASILRALWRRHGVYRGALKACIVASLLRAWRRFCTSHQSHDACRRCDSVYLAWGCLAQIAAPPYAPWGRRDKVYRATAMARMRSTMRAISA